MSNKLYNRKEFLIIIGGLIALIVMVAIAILSKRSSKSQGDNSKTSNSVSTSAPPDFDSREDSIDTFRDKGVFPDNYTIFTQHLNGTPLLELLEIPKGNFNMGSPPQEVGHLGNETLQPVEIEKSFYMSRYPITQEQWQAVMGDKNPSTFQGTNLPVETVSWYQAKEFCDKLTNKTQKTYRLPSEKEWEYACRAGTNTPFYFGDFINPEQANYDTHKKYSYVQEQSGGEYRGKTISVKKFPANKFGLQNMHGNVWEWCSDSWCPDKNGDVIDVQICKNKEEGEIASIRGGAWHSFPSRCRSAAREFMWKKVRSNRIGFRIVREE
jgi:Uncharacterized conserved protein